MTVEQVILIGLVSFLVFSAGFLCGRLQHKRKRDKEMAKIVAKRLLGEPQYSGPNQMISNLQQFNNGFANLIGSQIQGSSSLLGDNPIVTTGTLGNFMGMINHDVDQR